ncbi:hypothetical protein [Caudoviricetes sp.]|nr:hypothetical protein [Caudoviricetes sp.]
MCINKNKRNELIESLISYILENIHLHPNHIIQVARELLREELKKHSLRTKRSDHQENEK